MKVLKELLLITLLTILSVGCNKEDVTIEENLNVSDISAKWIVNDPDLFLSFEFDEHGNYIVVKKTVLKVSSDMIASGTYEIIDHETIWLSDFGTIKVNNISQTSFSFSLEILGTRNNVIDLTGVRAEEMKNTAQIKLLCRAWDMVSINGEDVVETANETTVLFSRAGTYLVHWHLGGGKGLAEWRWKEGATGKTFLYSWDAKPIWTDAFDVEILELTESSLVVREIYYYIESTFVLKPSKQ